jgi:hypothetical protein
LGPEPTQVLRAWVEEDERVISGLPDQRADEILRVHADPALFIERAEHDSDSHGSSTVQAFTAVTENL